MSSQLMQIRQTKLVFLKDASTYWHSGSPEIDHSSVAFKNSSKFTDCNPVCSLDHAFPLSLEWLAKGLGFNVVCLLRLNGSSAFLSRELGWLERNSVYLDMVLVFLLCFMIFWINISMMSKVYYVVFSQINLFTHKLQRYSKNMLKPSELSPISIDDLLFVEANEISDFFIEFFEMFHKNRENNSFDMTDSIEKITSQLKKTRTFRRKFNENIAACFERIFNPPQVSQTPSPEKKPAPVLTVADPLEPAAVHEEQKPSSQQPQESKKPALAKQERPVPSLPILLDDEQIKEQQPPAHKKLPPIRKKVQLPPELTELIENL